MKRKEYNAVNPHLNKVLKSKTDNEQPLANKTESNDIGADKIYHSYSSIVNYKDVLNPEKATKHIPVNKERRQRKLYLLVHRIKQVLGQVSENIFAKAKWVIIETLKEAWAQNQKIQNNESSIPKQEIVPESISRIDRIKTLTLLAVSALKDISEDIFTKACLKIFHILVRAQGEIPSLGSLTSSPSLPISQELSPSSPKSEDKPSASFMQNVSSTCAPYSPSNRVVKLETSPRMLTSKEKSGNATDAGT